MNQFNKELKLVTTLQNHDGAITSIISDRNYVYSASKDATLRIWKKNNWSEVTSLAHPSWVNCLALDLEKIYSGSSDSAVRTWKKGSWGLVSSIKHSRFSIVKDLTVDRENCYVVLTDRSLIIYSKKEWLEQDKLNHLGIVQSVKVDNRNIFTALSDGTVTIWSMKTHEIEKVLTLSSFKTVEQLEIDNSYIYTSIGKNIKVFDKKKKELVKELMLKKKVTSLAVDNSFLIVGSKDKKVQLWKKDTYREYSQLVIEKEVTFIYSDNDFIYVGCKDGKIKIYSHPVAKKTLEKKSTVRETATKKSIKKTKDKKEVTSRAKEEKKKKKKSVDYSVKEAKELMSKMSYEEIMDFTEGDKRVSIQKYLEKEQK